MARTCPDRVCPTQNPLEPFCHWSVEGPGASDEFVFLDLTFVLVTVSIRSHWWADRLQMPLRGTALKQDGRPKMVNVEKNMETSSLDLPFFKRSCPLEVRNALMSVALNSQLNRLRGDHFLSPKPCSVNYVALESSTPLYVSIQVLMFFFFKANLN